MAHKNAIRKHVVKGLAATKVKAFNVSEWTGKAHFHPCSDKECRLVYRCTCDTPEVNGRCGLCTQGRVDTFMEWVLPQDCCYGQCQLVVDLKIWEWRRLAGPGPWFQCPSCKRCFNWAVR